MKTVIYWVTKDRKIISRIRDRFNLSSYVSINGETPCEITEEDMEVLRECEKRGFIKIRNKHQLKINTN